MSYPPAGGGQALFDVETRQTVLSLDADDAEIDDGRWIVTWQRDSGVSSRAYRLGDRTIDWSSTRYRPLSRGKSPYYPALSGKGYGVVNMKTGRIMASWRPGCADIACVRSYWFRSVPLFESCTRLGNVRSISTQSGSQRRGRILALRLRSVDCEDVQVVTGDFWVVYWASRSARRWR
jgi:hypothetical protein